MVHALGRISPSQSAFFSNVKDARFASEQRKLEFAAMCILRSHPTMGRLGPDPFVEQLIAAAGFREHDLVVIRTFAMERFFTAVCVPTRVWRHPEEKLWLRAIAKQAEELGTRVLLVPQRWLKAPVRLAVARAIGECRNVALSNDDRHVVERILAGRVGTITECARGLHEHEDPFGAILAMAAEGFVVVDRSTRLSPETARETLRRLIQIPRTHAEDCPMDQALELSSRSRKSPLNASSIGETIGLMMLRASLPPRLFRTLSAGRRAAIVLEVLDQTAWRPPTQPVFGRGAKRWQGLVDGERILPQSAADARGRRAQADRQ